MHHHASHHRPHHRPRTVTIRDVARAAGASVATVSATINNSDYVSKGMRKRIRQAIRRLHYRPNDLARGLRLQRTRTIAIVVPDLSNHFYIDLVRGVKDYAGSANYTLLVGDSREKWEEERAYLDLFHRRRVDGIIRVPSLEGGKARAGRVLGGIPVVYADRLRTSGNHVVGEVGVDNVAAAEEAVRYLLSLGHRRIAIISGPREDRNSADRLEGYRRAMRGARIQIVQRLIHAGDNDFGSGQRCAIELLSLASRPTAVFCTNNLMALGALRAIQELKLRCPKDVSLLGFDDFEWAALLRPALTVVRQPAREIGSTAARALIDRLEDRTSASRSYILPTELAVRSSCAPPPAGL